VIRRDNSTPLGFHPKGKKRSSTDGLTAALEAMRQRQIDASQTDCGLLGEHRQAGNFSGQDGEDKSLGRLADGNREPEGQGGVRRF